MGADGLLSVFIGADVELSGRKRVRFATALYVRPVPCGQNHGLVHVLECMHDVWFGEMVLLPCFALRIFGRERCADDPCPLQGLRGGGLDRPTGLRFGPCMPEMLRGDAMTLSGPADAVACTREGCTNIPGVERRQRTKRPFCSRKCRQAQTTLEVARANPYHGLSTATVGAMSELAVAVDLIARGFEVFRALSPATSCDLAILKDGRLLRIEVRSALRNSKGLATYAKNPRDLGRSDILALRFRDGTVEYRPALGSPRDIK